MIVPVIAPPVVPELERPWLREPVIEPEPAPVIAPPLNLLWHFTTSAHLPRIVIDGFLNVPTYDDDPDLLWATTNSDDERTATDRFRHNGDPYRDGKMLRVRLGLHQEDFMPWLEAAKLRKWSPTRIDALAKMGRERGSNPDRWFARVGRLSLRSVIGADTRGYLTKRWRAYDLKTPLHTIPELDDCEGIEVAGKLYFSVRKKLPSGEGAYRMISPAEAEATIYPRTVLHAD